MFDPATGTWYLRNEVNSGAPDAGVFQYGGVGWIPVVGDWTGSGRTTIGVVDPRTMTWYLRNTNSAGAPDIAAFSYGGVGWKPVVGDWTGGGTTTIGVIDPYGVWYLRASNSAGAPDFAPFPYGLGSWIPVVGHWLIVSAAGLAQGTGANTPPPPRDGALTALGETLAMPSAGNTASSGTAPPSVAGIPVSAGEQALRPWGSALPSGTPVARHAYRAGLVRTAALDDLFATGLK
jgi:hypothetical protein